MGIDWDKLRDARCASLAEELLTFPSGPREIPLRPPFETIKVVPNEAAKEPYFVQQTNKEVRCKDCGGMIPVLKVTTMSGATAEASICPCAVLRQAKVADGTP